MPQELHPLQKANPALYAALMDDDFLDQMIRYANKNFYDLHKRGGYEPEELVSIAFVRILNGDRGRTWELPHIPPEALVIETIRSIGSHNSEDLSQDSERFSIDLDKALEKIRQQHIDYEALLNEARNGLDEEECKVLDMIINKKITLTEIAKELGISGSKITGIKERIINKILTGKQFPSAELDDDIPDSDSLYDDDLKDFDQDEEN